MEKEVAGKKARQEKAAAKAARLEKAAAKAAAKAGRGAHKRAAASAADPLVRRASYLAILAASFSSLL